MKKTKLIVVGTVLALILLIGGYRLWPWSFESVVGKNMEEMTVISCCLRVITSGSQSTYFYDSAEPEKMGEVVEILGSCGYQKDIRDLWPGGVHGLSSGRNYDGRDISVTLVFGEHEEWFNLMLVDRGQGITTDSEVVHLTDGGAFDRLAELIQEKGRLAPPVQ